MSAWALLVRAFGLVVLCTLVVLLAGCGGGTAEPSPPEEEQIVRPRPCADRPELCR